MFCFGGVKTHLGDMCLMLKTANLGRLSRFLRHSGGTPPRSEGPCHSVACPHHGVDEKRIFPILRLVAAELLFTVWKIAVFVLFHVSVAPRTIYWINKDPISV